MSLADQIYQIIKEVLKVDEVCASSSPENIENWDSLNHATIIDRIEKYFNIKIELMEMLDIENVKDVIILVERKIAS